jgi:hypothetical protein
MIMASPFFEKMTYEERMIWLRRQVIDTDDIVKIADRCEELWNMSGLMVEGDAGFVFGETGAGKSFGVAAFADTKFDELKKLRPGSNWIRVDVPGTPIRPIWERVPGEGERRHLAVVLVTPNPTYKSLLEDTAFALNVALPNRWTGGKAIKLIMDQLVAQKVKVIVFDEVQHIVEGGADSYSAADVFKIMAKARVQVLGVGLESYGELMFKGQKKSKDQEGVNAQLDRLKSNQVTLGPLSCSLNDFPAVDRNGKPITSVGFPATPFRDFCKALDLRDERDGIILPFDRSSDISNPVIALRLWRAFDGYVGQMMKFLIAATSRAIIDGQRHLTLPLFAEVYRRRAEVNDANNWFLMEWSVFAERFVEEPQKQDVEKGSADKRKDRQKGRSKSPLFKR